MSSKQDLGIEKTTIYMTSSTTNLKVFLPYLTHEHESWKPTNGITRQSKAIETKQP